MIDQQPQSSTVRPSTSLTNEVLLITAAINVESSTHVAIRDKRERLLQYLTSLVAWIKLSDISTIVFCENTNTNYDFSAITEFARKEGKTLEVLIFEGNQKAQKYGKGYGEGKIVEYAIKNSLYLKNNVNFYKITGRLFIPEFDQIQAAHAILPNVFQIPAFPPENDPWIDYVPPKSENLSQHLRAALRYLYVYFGRGRGRGPHHLNQHVSTVFYKSNVSFFKKNLMNSYKRVNDYKSYVLEHTYYEDLIRQNFSPFLMNYTIVGRSGFSGSLYCGKDYPEDIKALAETFIPSS
jgi:hypothetical protein